MMTRLFAILLLFLSAAQVPAVEPDEMLVDPALEARAQALDEGIRCVQCSSENIASSNAGWARDARLIVRSMISEGASDNEILDFFAERYGERVLMNPRKDGVNLLLWAAGPAMLLLSVLIAVSYVRGRRNLGEGESLSDAERDRLDEILRS